MNKLAIGMKLENKTSGEIVTVSALGEKVTITMSNGETKSYAASSLKRNYRLVIEEVTEEVITNELEKEEIEAAVDSKDEEVTGQDNSNIITEEEIDFNNKLAAQEKLIAEQAEAAALLEKAEAEFAKSLEQLEDKPENKPEPKPENKKADEPKVSLKPKFEAIVSEILSRMEKDESYKDLKVRPLTNNYASVKVTRNFVDLGVSGKNLKVSVLGLTYNSTLECKVVPDSFGWRLNTIFTVTDESQIEEVLRVIKLSYLEEIKPNEKDLAKAAAKAAKLEKEAKAKADKEAKAAKLAEDKAAKELKAEMEKIAKETAELVGKSS